MAGDLYAQWQAVSTVWKKEKPHYNLYSEALSLHQARQFFQLLKSSHIPGYNHNLQTAFSLIQSVPLRPYPIHSMQQANLVLEWQLVQ